MTLEELKSIVDQSFELLEPLSLSLRLEQDAEEREIDEGDGARHFGLIRREHQLFRNVLHTLQKEQAFY